jgi:hypothetical protein
MVFPDPLGTSSGKLPVMKSPSQTNYISLQGISLMGLLVETSDKLLVPETFI